LKSTSCIAVALAAAPLWAVAADVDLAKCRAIGDATQRLACYDALVPAAPATSTAPKLPAAAAAPAQKQPQQQFGLEQRVPADRPEAIDSHIPGRFEGWKPNTRIRLANGQVWQVVDNSSGAFWLMDPKVKVRRGMLGAFFLEIEGSNNSPKVRRIE
jgi:hypothetical protein